MRQRSQSALRTPLNRILGTQTHVRILRALMRSSHPQGAAELAQNTRRQISGVRRACAALVSAGIVEPVGAQRHRLYELREAHPLATALRSLFREEGDRPLRIAAAVRAAVRRLDVPPIAVWMQGPSAIGADREEGHVVIGVLAGARELERLSQRLRDELEELETAEDVTIETRGFTRADLKTLSAAEHAEMASSSPLLGPPPIRLGDARRGRKKRGANVRSHADLDARARALGAAIAEKIAREPGLIGRAQRWVADRMLHASPQEMRDLEEWEHLLRVASLPRLQRLLVDKGPWATRLRRTLPFLDTLSAAEREKALAESGR